MSSSVASSLPGNRVDAVASSSSSGQAGRLPGWRPERRRQTAAPAALNLQSRSARGLARGEPVKVPAPQTDDEGHERAARAAHGAGGSTLDSKLAAIGKLIAGGEFQAAALALNSSQPRGRQQAPEWEAMSKRFILETTRAGRSNLALQYASKFPPDVGLDAFASVLKAMTKLGDSEGAMAALRDRLGSGSLADSRGYSAFISSVSKDGKFDFARAAFEDAFSQGVRDVYVFNAYIAACARCGELARAEEAWAVMQREGVAPTAVTFNSLINLHGKAGNLAAARACYLEMRGSGHVPTERTFGALLAACASPGDGQPADSALAVRLYGEMKREGLATNERVCSALLTAIARGMGAPGAAPPAEAVARALEAFEDLKATGAEPNSQVLSALANVCARAGEPERALRVLEESPLARSNPYVLATVLTACRGDVQCARRALRALSKAPAASRTTGVLNAAIRLHWDTLGETERAVALLQAMAKGEAGPQAAPDVISYNSVIAACAAARQAARAVVLFREMRAAGLKPTARTFTALISAVGQGGGGLARAEAMFAEMRRCGVQPNEFVYGALLNAAVKADALDRAFAIFEEMRAGGVAASQVAFGTLLDGCKRANDVTRARAVYRSMVASGVAPNAVCHNQLVVACAREGLLDEMLEEVRLMARSGGAASQGTLSAVITALCRYQYSERALRIFSFMRTRGMFPDSDALSLLVESCAREQRGGAALQVFREAAAADVAVGSSALSALVEALCASAEVDAALEVAFPNAPELLSAAYVAERAAAALEAGGAGKQPLSPRVSSSSASSAAAASFAAEEEAADRRDDDASAASEAGAAAAATADEKKEPGLSRPPDLESPLRPAALAAVARLCARVLRAETALWALSALRRQSARAALAAASASTATSAVGALPPHLALAAEPAQTEWLPKQPRAPPLPAVGTLRLLERAGVPRAVRRALVEETLGALCLTGRLEAALALFDDVKEESLVVGRVPLAQLEALCKRDGSARYQWRIFDVCAEMRRQRDLRALEQARMAPRKACHHFGEWEAEEEGEDNGADDGDDAEAQQQQEWEDPERGEGGEDDESRRAEDLSLPWEGYESSRWVRGGAKAKGRGKGGFR